MITLLNTICNKPTTGVLVPLPQNRSYTTMLSFLSAEMVPYYLDKSKNWETELEAVKGAYKQAKERGTDLSSIQEISLAHAFQLKISKPFFEFAAKERLVIIADEVYQANIFKERFYSFKRVLRDLQLSYLNKYDNIELASPHSVSMGITGEGGQRGGFLELVGFNSAVQFHIYKLISFTNVCPTTALCLVELIVNPPREGSPSYELYKKENDDIFANLTKISFALYRTFKKMKGVEFDEPQESMQIFPTIKLPARFLQVAKKEGQAPDEIYATRLLKATGIYVMPSFFLGQNEGTLRFRATPLAFNVELVSVLEKFHNEFIDEFS
ncbi:putative alanine aminotransferase, mitochondrial [Erysiphe neolycopersici]|uniref:Putative alanine aminotransferase, mitochondrial n=1 Tax=Erysiphe neolycopersici TaxID=212602 RepID=A0A420HZU8_9PEZI|nr:putative alanine aminotransferase, mitochondrial [Erysiphe neolycopersici]